MSNLMNAITYKLTGGQRPDTKLTDFIRAGHKSIPTDGPLLVEIEIYATFLTRHFCNPDKTHIDFAIDDFKRDLTNEIFGEFREKLLKWRSLYYSDDVDVDVGTALGLINEMLNDIDSV